MKITIKKSDLNDALSRAAVFAEKRGSATVILASVLLRATGDSVEYTAGDKSVTLRGRVPATVESPGEVLVDVGYLRDAARNLPGDVVTVEVVAAGGNLVRVELSSGKSVYKLVGQPATDYPAYAPEKPTKAVVVSAADLGRVLDQVVFAAAGEDNCYGLGGTHVEVAGSGADARFRMVATDGNRLQWAQCAFTGELGISKKQIVPRRAWAGVEKLLGDGPVTLAFGDRALLVSADGWEVSARLMEADFPDYRQVLPTSHKRSIVTDRAEMMAALRRVMLFATDNTHTITFKIQEADLTGGQRVVLSSRKLDAGDAREEVPVEFTGEPLTTGFNVKFLQDALGVLAGDQVRFELGDALSPCILRDPGSEDVLSVVMPCRID